MIAYIKGWTRKKDSIFAAISAAEGAVALPLIGVSFRGFSESDTRARAALAVAKKQPKGAFGRAVKYRLIRAQYNWARRYFMRHPDRIAMCWNGITGSRRAFMEGARDAGAARLYVELAPFPNRVTLDHAGVNALNSLPREAQFYRDWAAQDATRQGDDWRALGANLTARVSRRADVGQADAAALSGAGKFLFCPLQVPNDSQITLFAGWVKSVEGLLRELADAAQALPDGWHIRVKEHPSARASLEGPLAAAVVKANGRIIVDNQTDTFAQVEASAGVITINSSVGLQAFFHDKPVVVLGQAFFALPGLVTPATSADALRAAVADPAALGFDAKLRAAFMTYLDQVYYPRSHTDAAGILHLDKAAVAEKLSDARAHAGR